MSYQTDDGGNLFFIASFSPSLSRSYIYLFTMHMPTTQDRSLASVPTFKIGLICEYLDKFFVCNYLVYLF